MLKLALCLAIASLAAGITSLIGFALAASAVANACLVIFLLLFYASFMVRIADDH